jgi:hypothetical protein
MRIVACGARGLLVDHVQRVREPLRLWREQYVAIVAFVVSFIFPTRYGLAFLKGFLSLFILWFGICFWLSFKNSHILAEKISLLILNVSSPFLLVLITALIGGLVGGFSALSGALLRGKS